MNFSPIFCVLECCDYARQATKSIAEWNQFNTHLA